MAMTQMNEIRRRAIETHGLLDAAIVHRLGRLGPGAASIAVVVVAAHRAEAFEAIRRIVDAVKTDVPIWKKDCWTDGTETWTDPTVTK
jgi:molybdopterin synthase catalytic subunit